MFKYKYDISIVMGYYNRKQHVIRTLDDFQRRYFKYNFEVIIVDDNSKKEHILDDTIKLYTFPIKYIKINKEEKGGRINPCITYNKGFRKAEGKYIIIQNPECIHVGNILEYTLNNINENNYVAFSCFRTLNNQMTINILNIRNEINDENQFIDMLTKKGIHFWYNHPIHRPVHYHFCAAILNDNIKILGGFNEDFAKGAWYDDNEILLSITKNLKCTINTIPPEEGLVIHQWHAREAESSYSKTQHNNMISVNKTLYDSYVRYHARYNFNFPKLLHLYWDGSKLSYLNLLTVLSFNRYHFGWKINIYCPINPVKTKSWKTTEQKKEYSGKDYFNSLKNISNVFIHKIDFNNIPFKYKDASEIIKSDYFRIYILNKYGGLWSDFDIIYFNNIEDYYHNKGISEHKNVILYRYSNVYPVGLFLCNRNNSVFDVILKHIESYYNKDYYQCLGSSMIQNLFHSHKAKQIILQMKLSELHIDNADCYLPFKWNKYELLYNNNTSLKKETYKNNKNILGIHWFNGGEESKEYNNRLDNQFKDNSFQINCLMDQFVKEYI